MAIRQLVIGVDAMEWDLVRLWAAQGKLPVLRRLLDQGAHAELSTTAAQFPDTAWTSLMTGVNPANFEKYFYVQYEASGMCLRYMPDEAITAAPVWKTLSDAGTRVGVAEIPHFPVAHNLDGFQLSNWGTHGPTGGEEAEPASLMAQVRERFGRHPVQDCDAFDDKPAALCELRDRILKGVRAHGQLFRWLMRNEPCQVFIAAFSGTHCAGHHFWRFADQEHPRHISGDGWQLSGAIEDVYRAIDGEIGEMLELAGEDVSCIVVSGHGMGPVFHASWNLSEILRLMGYGRASGPIERKRDRAGSVNPWRLLKMLLPGGLQYAIRSVLPRVLRDKLLYLWYAGGQDWTGCRAFAVPNNDTVGAIRVSVRGRDQGGLISPGSEYETVCRDIADGLRELTDPTTGRSVVRQVTISCEEFSGPFLHLLPDITVLWDQRFPWDSLHSPRFGTMRVKRQDSRSGSHTPHGFALFHGPGVHRGRSLEGHSIYDLVPTILSGAGVALPPNLDGKPIPWNS